MILTDSQLRAATTLGKHLCVDAGAGSGKTGVLVARVVHILEQRKADLSEIVAITFTRKAAAEMKGRLRKAFHDKAPPDNPEAMTYWRDLERRVDTARIATIDSFCSSLLREHALSVGIDPDFSMLAEAEGTLLRREIASEALGELLDAGDGAAQRVAVEHGIDQVEDTLVALLGRSEVLERIAYEHPLDDGAQLSGHWAKLFAEEQKSRLERLRDSGRLERFKHKLERFEGMCAKPSDGRECARLEMIRILGEMAGSSDVRTIEACIEELCAVAMKGARKANWASERVYKELSALQTVIKESLKSYKRSSLDAETEEAAAALTVDLFAVYSKVAARYETAKSARATMDFADLMSRTIRLLETSTELRRRVASGIKHLLIDEFQDTNAGQFKLANHLMALANESGAELFVVGDAKQSIYKFRGAEVEVFARARELADETITLDRNFRSVPDVMNFINDFFRRSRALEEVDPDHAGMRTNRKSTGETRVSFLVPHEPENTKGVDFRVEEANLIAGRIAEMCAPGGAFVYDPDADCSRPAAYGDVAILFRTSTQITTYADALRAREVPHTVVQGSGFYKKQEISDFRNLLETVLDPWDEMALLGFLRSPVAAISDETLMELCAECALADAFQSERRVRDEEQNRRLDAARDLIARLREHVELPLAPFMRYALGETSFEAILLSQHHGVQKAGNVRKLVDLAGDFAHTGPARLRTFTRYLDDLATKEIREGDAELFAASGGAVTLMTAHKSKGLEFNIVVIADTAAGPRNPSLSAPYFLHRRLGLVAKVHDSDGETLTPGMGELIRKADRDEDEAERARLLYVAMTRARDWLLIGGSPKPSRGSWFELLDDAYGVARQADGQVIDGEGWAASVQRTPVDGRAQDSASRKRRAESVEVLLKNSGPLDFSEVVRGTVSISELLDRMGSEGSESTAYAKASEGPALDPLLRGTLMHRLLELWDFGKDETPPIERVVSMECPAIDTREVCTNYLSEASARFADSELFARFQRTTGIRKELPFLFRLGDSMLSGTIDALLPDGTIVDYKTGKHRPESHRRYETQLRLYAAAVKALTGRVPEKALLFYIDPNEVHEVDLAEDLVVQALEAARSALP